MSVVVKIGHRKAGPGSTIAMWMVLGVAVLFFLVRFGQEWLLEHELETKAAEQRIANARLRDENTRLKAALQYYLSDKYIEQRAREDLNLRRADEEVLIPVVVGAAGAGQGVEGELLAPSPSTGQTETPTGDRPPQANWQKWLDLFKPR